MPQVANRSADALRGYVRGAELVKDRGGGSAVIVEQCESRSFHPGGGGGGGLGGLGGGGFGFPIRHPSNSI